MFTLSQKVVLVTGASHGLGAGIADTFVRVRADVGCAAVFLNSDEARFITGASVDMNGGGYLR